MRNLNVGKGRINPNCKNSVYLMSKSIDTVSVNSFDKSFAKKILNAKDRISRQKYAEQLVQYLAKKLNIPKPYINIVDKPRQKNGNSILYGYYNRALMNIVVYNLTAVKQMQVSNKELLNTIIHEFIHHYDFFALNLEYSPHTIGFNKRINDLQNKLIA